MKLLKIFFFSFLLLLTRLEVEATHIKAGEITAKRLNQNTYQFTMILYLKMSAVEIDATQLGEATADFKFSDGTQLTVARNNPSLINIGNDTYKNTYVFNKTVPNGALFTVSYENQNRNADIKNIPNSSAIPFFIQTTINTNFDNLYLPILTYPPIDEGTMGQIYTHNPGAYEPEGDSISYSMISPRETNGNFVQYTAPENVQPTGPNVNGGPAYSNINPITGDFTWDAPAVEGLYNIAIEISEWRKSLVDDKYYKISTVVRDMQINIKKNPNRRPEIYLPQDTCIQAATALGYTATLHVADPDSIAPNYQNLLLYWNSAIIPPATVTMKSPVPPTANRIKNSSYGTIKWNPTCADVRQLPYFVYFKAEDDVVPSLKLVTFKTLTLKVNGPKPSNVSVTRNSSGGFKLSWDKYPCSNADSIIIYRKVCSKDTFVTTPCEIDAPLGYKQLTSVDVNTTSFIDTSDFEQGSSYCYILGAVFSGNKGGKGVLSDEQCISTYYEEPIVAGISVIKSDVANGKVRIQWFRPPVTQANGNFEYKLYRATTANNSTAQQVFSSKNMSDTSFVDSIAPFNTIDFGYSYQLNFYRNDTLYSEGPIASTVLLKGEGLKNKVKLNWKWTTPMDFSEYKHIIYRKGFRDTLFKAIDSIEVTKNTADYEDKNFTKQDTFCYYVETRGKYCLSNLPKPLVHQSQQICVIPQFEPCPPVLSLVDENCNLPLDSLNQKPYKNFLSWKNDSTGAGCKIELSGYKLYKAPYEDSEYHFVKFIGKDTLNYIDLDYESRASCYQITAVSSTGLESARSNTECNDNCTYYALPNLITPNNDGHNDEFTPYNYPIGVRSVRLYIYNRWGGLVHYQEGDPYLHWNPYKTNPNFTAGVYYYYAVVQYERRKNHQHEEDRIKGWLQITEGSKLFSNE